MAWSTTVRNQARCLRGHARALHDAARSVTLPGPEGTALRQRILDHAGRADNAAHSLERTADELARHEAVLAALTAERGATHIG